MQEELSNAQNEVKDKIQALQWADSEKKTLNENIKKDNEKIKHFTLVNEEANNKLEQLNSNYDQLKKEEDKATSDLSNANLKYRKMETELQKKLKTTEKEN